MIVKNTVCLLHIQFSLVPSQLKKVHIKSLLVENTSKVIVPCRTLFKFNLEIRFVLVYYNYYPATVMDFGVT